MEPETTAIEIADKHGDPNAMEAIERSELHRLMNLTINGEKAVKCERTSCKFDERIDCIDLLPNAADEVMVDKMYTELPYLTKNLRRGNSLISIQKDGEDKPVYLMGRKGLMKFHNFEMTDDGDVERLGTTIKLKQPGCERLKLAFQNGKHIKMVRTLKADGENV